MSDATPNESLAGEIEQLDALLAGLADYQWAQRTPFRDWSVSDHVRHLWLSERTALRAIEQPALFAAEVAAHRSKAPRSAERAAGTAREPTPAGGATLRSAWRETAQYVRAGLARLPVGARIPWFGPAMSASSFATARLMEIWAHGESVRDAVEAPHLGTERLRHVCELGWRTRRFALLVHDLPPDDRPIYLELVGPDGASWVWGAVDAVDRIQGSARDFARVVCQCRNVADTRLIVTGDAAAQWMQVAQCFAGGRSVPPAPGQRKTRAD